MWHLCRRTLLLAVLGGLSTCLPVESAQSKAASITLTAKWDSTPTLLEAAEFLAEEEEAFLWRFIDGWHSSPSAAGEDCWEQIAQTAEHILSPSMTKVLQVVLGIRQYSPRLELLRTEAEKAGIPEGTCAFVDFGSQRAATPEELQTALKALAQIPTEGLTLQPFDHIFPCAESNASAPAVTAILYGAIGTEAFWAMHQVLMKAANTHNGASEQPRLRYVYRPVLLEGCSSGETQAKDQCFALGAGQRLRLPGFGVQMAIKNMEYSALDDNKVAAEKAASTGGREEDSPLEDLNGFDFKRLVERKPGLKQELLGFRDYLLASSSAEETLKVWDLKDLGLQASQRIARASDPLRSLADISQNFPNLAASLSRLRVEKSIRAELKRNQEVLPGGANFMLLNGLFLDPEVDIYELIKRIRKEVRLAEQLKESRLDAVDVAALLALRSQAEPPDAQELRIDLVSGGHVAFVNNLEKDAQYRGWGWSVTELLRPMFPGTLPRVGRNLFNLVMLIDPGTPQGIRLAKYGFELAAAGQWPVRVGVLLAPHQMLQRITDSGDEAASAVKWEDLSPGEKAAGLFAVLQQEEDALTALNFLASIPEPTISLGSDAEPRISAEAVEAAFEKAVAEIGGLEGDVSTADAADSLVAGGVARLLAVHAASIAATGVSSRANSMWLNGAALPDAMPTLQAKLGYGLQYEMQRIQEIVYFGKLKDTEEDIPAFLLKHFKAVARYNPRITEPAGSELGAPRQLPLIGKLAGNTDPLASLGYLHHPGTEDTVKAITHWVAANLNNVEDRGLVVEALKHLHSPASAASRVGILQCTTPAQNDKAVLLRRAVMAATQLPARRSKIPAFLVDILMAAASGQGELTEEAVILLAESAGLNSKAMKQLLQDSDKMDTLLAEQNKICRDALGLASDASAVVTNGRVILAYSPSQNVTEGLVAADFLLLDNFVSDSQLAKQVSDVIEEALSNGRARLQMDTEMPASNHYESEFEEATVEQLSDAALVASSVLAAYLASDPYRVQGQAGKVTEAVQELQGEHTAISQPGAHGGMLEITAVVDPLTKVAQQLSAILDFLRSTLQPGIKVHLNPNLDLSTLPLTGFYRFAMPTFPRTGNATLGMPGLPTATFNGLPSTKVLTLHMDVPEAWLVEPVRAAYDLDNLRLSDLGSASTLTAEFELEALLLTGSCTDVAAKTREQMTPRGVQLHLGSAKNPHLVDTLVMSNLGYFQLKAAPGVFSLRLAPGRSQELYTVVQPGPDPSADEEGQGEVQIPVVIDSLQGKHQRLKLRKRPGHESADVLDEDEQGGLLKSVSSWFGVAKGGVERSPRTGGKLSPEDDPETIHIFTIASGHMYERLQKIMILSMVRNTRNRVKVWFIKNYMSPQMKRFLPHMAAQYGFDYEFVTYKWPSWLHKQTDKQRIIWAYKILFLDVLFPLNLRKVIFVDSDQIIRADFAELWRMDLKGSPLAYTPFCDNNKDMDGFRFWKQGFWKDHLRGRPYHISALYVVDLAQFRQMAAGDQLRIVYEQLSKDPNSLANLDQDLPNYAQHMVPIHSLSQEWLWCETWCGNSTKAAAKTIDLCNNPLTKEPKLQGARRIVAEWPALDAEAQAFTSEIEDKLSRQAQEAGAAFERGELLLSSSTQEETLAASTKEAEEDNGSEEVQHADSREAETSAHDPTEL